MAAHGELFFPADHDGFVAGDWAGLVTYRVQQGECEITLLEADPSGVGIGAALLNAVLARARAAGCGRAWLVTTNDNVHALGWYERRGFTVEAVHAGAVDRARATLKPSIPTRNPGNGLAISDEIVLTMTLA